jgi:exonuclease VII small subunit
VKDRELALESCAEELERIVQKLEREPRAVPGRAES